MATITMTLEEYEELMAQVRSMAGNVAHSSPAIDKPAKKSKRSAYNRELSKQLKKVKQMHPRTLQKDLMAKAHKLTRKALKMPPKRKSRK